MTTARTRFRRRRVASLSAAALAISLLTVTACAATPSSEGSAPTEQVHVAAQLNWLLNVEYAGWHLAQENGYWEEEGLDVELSPGGINAIKPEQALVGGTAQIAASTFRSVLSAVQAGEDLVVIGAVYPMGFGGVISLSENPINDVADLEGKTIGANPEGATWWRNILGENGLDPDGFTAVATAEPNALVQGEIDGFLGSANNQVITLESQGHDVTVLSAESVGMHDYTEVIVTTREYLEDNRATVVSFMRGLIKGQEIYFADPEAGAAAVFDAYGADLGLDAETARKQALGFTAAMVDDVTEEKGLLWIAKENVEGKIYPGLVAFMGMTDLPEVSTVVDLTVLDEAYDGATSLIEE